MLKENNKKYPVYKQYDAMDCGPVCLRMVSKYYGKSYSIQYLRNLCKQKKTGTSLLGISEAAETIGFKTIGVKITFEQLCTINSPCIINWNQNHFVVLYQANSNRVCVGDPAVGCILKYDMNTFLKSWCSVNDAIRGNMGIALLLEPSVNFDNIDDIERKDDNQRIGFKYLLRFLTPHKKSILKICFGILLGSIFSMLFPILTQIIVDVGIENKDYSFIKIILLAQFVLIVGQALNNIIKNWLMLHVTIRINISLVSNFLSKLMKLPISFFDTKRTGDTIQRIRDFDRIQFFLTSEIIGMSMGILGLLVYSIMMAGYNSSILLVFLIGSMLYIIWVVIFMKRRRKLDYMRFQVSARNESNIIQMINSMQEIKMNTCEKQKLWDWEKTQNRIYDIGIKGLSLSQIQNIGSIFIDQIKNIIISYISASLVINGDLTIGMMMSIQYIIGQLNAPVSEFVSFIRSYQDTKISLERLDEIQQIKDEEETNNYKKSEIPQDANIVINNLMFQYNGPRSRKVLDNINLIIPYNKTTAIVGASGSGKTTLLKIILGFYDPVKGEVLLDNIPLNSYNIRNWRQSCGVVMQEGYIFSDTIANNIAISDTAPDIAKIKEAAKISNLDSFVEALPLGYNTIVGTEGMGLSSGQKQRILIARAVYKNSKYIIFDEATNALDANNEKIIMDNLNAIFVNKTVIVVAHRLSTVKNADNIIVLDHGKIVEMGTHTDLVARRKYYYSLVNNQLELGM